MHSFRNKKLEADFLNSMPPILYFGQGLLSSSFISNYGQDNQAMPISL